MLEDFILAPSLNSSLDNHLHMPTDKIKKASEAGKLLVKFSPSYLIETVGLGNLLLYRSQKTWSSKFPGHLFKSIYEIADMGLKAIHFGGGNIGRGFVAEKLSLSGYEVCRIVSPDAVDSRHTHLLTYTRPQVVFVDVMDDLIHKLQNTKEYTVTEIGGEGEKVNTITGYRAINSKTHEQDVIKEISTADIVELFPPTPSK